MTFPPLKNVELKTNKLNTLIVTGLTEEQKNFIISHKNKKTLEEASKKLGINCETILLIGSTNKLNTSNIGPHLGQYQGPDTGNKGSWLTPNREIHYRDYRYSYERQKKTTWLVNICPDMRMSITSLKCVLDSEYCCIWKRKN